MKGAGVDGEIGAAEKAIRKYKLRDVEVLVLGEGVVPASEVTRVFPGIGRLSGMVRPGRFGDAGRRRQLG